VSAGALLLCANSDSDAGVTETPALRPMRASGAIRSRRVLAGLTPSLNQSGESASQGQITKTGSGIAGRLLVEAAHHHARPPRIGATPQYRQAGQPDHILQIAWRAQHGLHRTHRRLRARGKPDNVATVAAARELAGFPWAAATAP
jgi:transposase